MIDERCAHPGKIYIGVDARFGAEGSVCPVAIIWNDGRRFEIDEVIEVCRATSLKAGGAGIRYTCRILGKRVCLFLENNRWFVEAKH